MYLEQKMEYIAKESSKELLHKLGIILPFSIAMNIEGEDLLTYYPRDKNPEADWDKLIDLNVNYLHEKINSNKYRVGAVALVTTLESGDMSGVGVQIETREGAYFVLFPYVKENGRYIFKEREITDSLLVDTILKSK